MGALNYRLLVEYDGSALQGWQFQKEGRTVQAELEAALRKVTNSEQVAVTGAGRTDAGVHARGQVANITLDTTITVERLATAVNSQLPEDIRVQAVDVVPTDFHARFSAMRRRYSYSITTSQPVLGRQYVWPVEYALDLGALEACAELVLGEHHFAGFAKAGSDVESTVCNVDTSCWVPEPPLMIYNVAANRFLHHMVRYLVGTMVEVARDRYSLEQFNEQLDRPPGPITVYRAPARGLVLESVDYPSSAGKEGQ